MATTTPAPEAIVYIDPKGLTTHPTNVRSTVGDVGALAASIKDNGVLQPLVVVPTDDGGHQILFGHRRAAAAIEAGVAQVPCIERPDLAGLDADQVVTQCVENLRREDLTDIEEARAYQLLLDLGLSATRIAKRTGTRRDRVQQAVAVTGNDAVIAAAEAHALTLDQAAALVEFADDPEAVEALTAATYDGPGYFDHLVAQLRQERIAAEERAQQIETLTAAGVTVLEDRAAVPTAQVLSRLVDADGEPVTEDGHASCPGHAATFHSWSKDPVYLCTDPDKHGHVDRWPTSNTARDTRTDEERTTERRRIRQGNKAWRAATEVRRTYLKDLLARTTVPNGTLRFVTEEIIAHPEAFGRARDEMLAEVVPSHGTPTPSYWERRIGPAMAAKAPDKRLPLVLLAQLAADREQSMTEHTWQGHSPDAARWLSWLAGTGYTLAEIEQQVVNDATPTHDAEGEDVA